jgi:hypothetical protein
VPKDAFSVLQVGSFEVFNRERVLSMILSDVKFSIQKKMAEEEVCIGELRGCA